MGVSIKYDYRFDPFTEADQAIDIADEDQVCPANSPFYVDLEEVPRENSPSSITAYDVTGDVALTEVSTNPSTNEFRVDYKYKTGKVMLHSSAANHTIRFNYKGTGHSIAASVINALSDWIGKNYTPGDDHDHDGTDSKVVTNISGNAATATNAANAANADEAANAVAISDGVVSTEAKLASRVVSQSKLKTDQAEVSVQDSSVASSGVAVSLLTLPGGEYGFYPRLKAKAVITQYTGPRTSTPFASIAYKDDSTGICPVASQTGVGTTDNAYVTQIRLGMSWADTGGGSTGTNYAYANQRYVTASGNEHWLFFLVNKETNEVKASWYSPDHPCYGQGMNEIEMSHPFLDYDSELEYVVLVENSAIEKLKNKITRKKTILSLIHDNYEIDLTSEPIYEAREIIEIDEYGDLPGEKLVLGYKEVKAGKNKKSILEPIYDIETPDWAKIKIKSETYSLKKRIVNTLPENILYKKLKKKEVV